jgi:2-keto-3-deoxy-L-rhamnonate aldolase RhmA
MAAELAGLRRRLHAPEPLAGAILSVPEPGVATILGSSGFDYVVVDAEHGPFTLASLRAVAEALAATDAHTIVRVAANDPTLIKQTLELGVDGIQVPGVGSAAQAAAAVRAIRYAPEGERGIGVGRSTRYGLDLPGYLHEANARTAALVMIEDAAGVQHAAEIAATPGLDAIIVGPLDLSAGLGVIGEPDHPVVHEAITRIVRAGREAGVPVGLGGPPGELGSLVEQGSHVTLIFFDVLDLGAAARAAVRAARESLPADPTGSA